MRRGDCSRNRPAVFLTCFILRETLNKSFAAEWRIFYPICADRRNTGHNAPFSASGKFRLCPDSSSPHKGRCPLWGPRNGKYIQYSHILRTFSCGKISRHQRLPIFFRASLESCWSEENGKNTPDFDTESPIDFPGFYDRIPLRLPGFQVGFFGGNIRKMGSQNLSREKTPKRRMRL